MRCFARSVRPSDDILASLVCRLEFRPDSLDALRKRVAVDRASIQARFDSWWGDGQTLAGYGAPAQLTTLCYALGITDDHVQYIVDDNPLKVGRFTPGRGIPIVPVSELYARAPDVCLIFSANFADDIQRRHPEFKGEWVVV